MMLCKTSFSHDRLMVDGCGLSSRLELQETDLLSSLQGENPISMPIFMFEILKYSQQKSVNFLTLQNFTL